MRAVLLADDLSGALEAGAAFARNGWRPRLSLREDSSLAVAPAELSVISTETRNFSADAARRTVAAVLAQVAAAGQTLIYKKIDSTLRGPVGAELQALLAASSRPIVFTSANPPAGRTVRDGILRVGGIPVAETAFRHDPLMPVQQSVVADLLASAGALPCAEIPLAFVRGESAWDPRELTRQVAGGVRVLLADAETSADLARLVAWAESTLTSPCFVGSGALASAVAAAHPPPAGGTPLPLPPLGGRLLFVAGSRHPLSHAQVEKLGLIVHRLEAGGKEDELAAAVSASFQTTDAVCLTLGPAPGDPLGLSAALARVVGKVDRAVPLAGIFATGGETARSICEALAGTHLQILEETEPGVVLSHLFLPGGWRWLVTKPGGFGDPNTLQRVHRQWRQPRTGAGN